MYTNGTSERIVGAWMKERSARHKTVLATKFTFNTAEGDPNAGGNGRKHMMLSLEDSLRRLQTDHVDLYWVHAWDGLTPVDEVMRALDDVVRQGKVRYVGLSDVPGWIAARAQSVAEWRGYERVCALQLEYSLIERNIEREHVPCALELGMGIVPWSPLGAGLLTGKFTRDANGALSGDGRLRRYEKSSHPGFAKLFSAENWRVLDVLKKVAGEMGKSPAQVAIAWVMQRPAVSSTILGATTLGQLEDTLRAVDVKIPAELLADLDKAGAPPVIFPFSHFMNRGTMTGRTTLRREPPGFRPRD